MREGTGGRTARLAGWRAWMARSFAAVLLLASLLAPPFAESAFSGAASTAAAVSAAAAEGGAPAVPSRQDGSVHAGTHCACQLADRSAPPVHAAPAAFSDVVHPATAARALTSLEAEPPARPPRA